MTLLAAAKANIERHHIRRYENVILKDRFHPSLGQWFDIAEEIRLIRLRDAEQALATMGN